MSETSPTANLDHSTEQISTKVVTAIADHKNVDPLDLPPLYETFDPDALDRLFRPTPSGTTPLVGEVSFSFAGCDVVVDSAERVTVTSGESDSERDLVE